MNIKKLLLAAFFLSISIGSFAARGSAGGWDNLNGPNNRYLPSGGATPDYQCVEECTNSGYGHRRDVCQRRCSY